MTAWFFPPHYDDGYNTPLKTEITTALEALVTAYTQDELHHVLEQWQQVLFADATLVVLCLTGARESVNGNNQFAETLQGCLALLEDACINGIASAWQHFASAQGEAQDSPDISLPRHIEILTQAITSIEHVNDPYVQAELYSNRSIAYMDMVSLEEHTEHIERAIADLDAALEVFTCEEHPIKWMQMHVRRGLAYTERIEEERALNIEQAIVDFDLALNVLAHQDMPFEWAITLALRGQAYTNRSQGERDDNLEQAIADFNAALQVITYQDTPEGWVETYLYRIDAYMQCTRGASQAEKIEQAIADYTAVLEVLSFEHMPRKWLQACGNRALAYMERTTGERTQNIAKAIADFDAVLHVVTREDGSQDWALTHMNRGIAYLEHIQGGQAENLEQAIADFDTALAVFTRKDTPLEWAHTHIYRGLAYMDRMYGERARNVEQALNDFQITLEVFTREVMPHEWAIAYLNQGFAYSQRIRGERAENLEQAIAVLNEALEVLTPENSPREWALTYMNRGLAYMERIRGERTENLEQAIRDCDRALTIFTREAMPFDWAKTGLNRTLAYTQRMRQHHKENMEHAINDYNAILEVFTPETAPRYWAMTRMNRGVAYLDRSLGSEAENLEQAIADFDAALTVYDPETMFHDWVLGHLNHGYAYSQRIQGNRAQNLEQAIADNNAILAVLTPEQMPRYWAQTCINRGIAFVDRIYGDPTKNLEQAISDYNAALTVFTRNTTPREYRDVQLNLAHVYEQLRCWQETYKALHEAREVTQVLVETASTEAGRTEVIGERTTLYLRETQALLRCEPPDFSAAVRVLEEGRAQNLRTALDLDAIAPERTSDPAARARAEKFVIARDAWQQAQRGLSNALLNNPTLSEGYAETMRQRPHLNATHKAFIQTRDAIRQHDDPNFLAPKVTLEEIGHAVTALDTALVYIAAGEERGLALVVMRTPAGPLKVEHLSLPQLTRKAINKLLMGADTLPPLKLMQTLGGPQEVPFLTDGLWLAQLGQAFEFLTMWGENIREAIRALPEDSGFLKAALHLVYDWASSPEQQQFLNQSFAEMKVEDRLAIGKIFSNILINVALKRSLPVIGELGLSEVAWALRSWGIRDATIIPYGSLGLFPLPAVLVRQPDGSVQRFSDLFTVTLAPSARAKAIALTRASSLDRTARPLLLAVGNPQPLPQRASNLVFAEAEADTTRRIAMAYNYPSGSIRFLRLKEATREGVAAALEQTWYAHLAVHGQYDIINPRRSRLLLAGNESIREDERSIFLSEALDGTVNLKGLRLLVLSACETALIDTYYAPDEVQGLAAGFLQAGAAGVIASLWAVDDKATYLLMSRFAEFYLDPQRNWSPAHALAEAQRWLREEATNEVLKTYNPTQQVPLPSESTLRSLRYTHSQALRRIKLKASSGEPGALPYADPIYWAAFVVTGC